MGQFKVGIVIPAYNEAERIPRTLAELQKAIREGLFENAEVVDILVVDDGSTDLTAECVLAPVRLLKLEINQGKGSAVRAGIQESQGEWVLIADADGSTPWKELNALLLAHQKNPHVKVIIGSRGMKDSQLQVRQSWLREHLGKLFNRLIVGLTGLPFRDTQCGFKLIHGPTVLPWMAGLTINRFAWDVEFLLEGLSRKIPIVEVPIAWKHEAGSKVRLWRDGLRMVWDFLKIRIRVRRRVRS